MSTAQKASLGLSTAAAITGLAQNVIGRGTDLLGKTSLFGRQPQPININPSAPIPTQ
jgi:hypothetical protein